MGLSLSAGGQACYGRYQLRNCPISPDTTSVYGPAGSAGEIGVSRARTCLAWSHILCVLHTLGGNLLSCIQPYCKATWCRSSEMFPLSALDILPWGSSYFWGISLSSQLSSPQGFLQRRRLTHAVYSSLSFNRILLDQVSVTSPVPHYLRSMPQFHHWHWTLLIQRIHTLVVSPSMGFLICPTEQSLGMWSPGKQSRAIGQYRQIPTSTRPASQPVPVTGDKVHMLLKHSFKCWKRQRKGPRREI